MFDTAMTPDQLQMSKDQDAARARRYRENKKRKAEELDEEYGVGDESKSFNVRCFIYTNKVRRRYNRGGRRP